MIISFGKLGKLDNEKTVNEFAEVIKARIRGEPDASIRRYLRKRYAAFLHK